MMAGPCSVENRANLLKTARMVKKHGAAFLRGGAFKPRTSPYSFQGLGEEGLKYLAEARKLTGLKIVTEVMEISQIELVAEYADILQVGARNMQNFMLLKAVGEQEKPVLLKRGMSATMEEFLLAAEYINHLYEPVVLLAAPDRILLSQAIAAISVEVEALRPVLTIAESLRADTVIWGEDNIFADYTITIIIFMLTKYSTHEHNI